MECKVKIDNQVRIFVVCVQKNQEIYSFNVDILSGYGHTNHNLCTNHLFDLNVNPPKFH